MLFHFKLLDTRVVWPQNEYHALIARSGWPGRRWRKSSRSFSRSRRLGRLLLENLVIPTLCGFLDNYPGIFPLARASYS